MSPQPAAHNHDHSDGLCFLIKVSPSFVAGHGAALLSAPMQVHCTQVVDLLKEVGRNHRPKMDVPAYIQYFIFSGICFYFILVLYYAWGYLYRCKAQCIDV